MLRQFRYQTGEIKDIIQEIHDGKIPCMDVVDSEEMDWVFNELIKYGFIHANEIPYDRNARDKVKEPEFEYRVTFYHKGNNMEKKVYIDFYFEPEIEESYAQIGFD